MIKKGFSIEENNFWYDGDNPVEDINDLNVGDYVEIQDEKEGIIIEITDYSIFIDWVPVVVYWLSEDKKYLYLNVMNTKLDDLEEYKSIKKSGYKHISRKREKKGDELETIKRWKEKMKNEYIFEVEEEKVKEWIDRQVEKNI